MLSVLIATTLAAASPQSSSTPPASAAYADCLLAHLQPGLSDHAIPLLQQACVAKYPESYVAYSELERRISAQRRADLTRLKRKPCVPRMRQRRPHSKLPTRRPQKPRECGRSRGHEPGQQKRHRITVPF